MFTFVPHFKHVVYLVMDGKWLAAKYWLNVGRHCKCNKKSLSCNDSKQKENIPVGIHYVVNASKGACTNIGTVLQCYQLTAGFQLESFHHQIEGLPGKQPTQPKYSNIPFTHRSHVQRNLFRFL